MIFAKANRARLEKMKARKGIYVDTVDHSIYRGPTLQRWDYFRNTKRASKYIGCTRDEVDEAFREAMFEGRGGDFNVNGVRFIAASYIHENLRPPLCNPNPPRKWKRRVEADWKRKEKEIAEESLD